MTYQSLCVKDGKEYIDVFYWRNSNQIFHWFYKNVAKKRNFYGRYKVSKEKLRELLEILRNITKENASELLPTIDFDIGTKRYDDKFFQDVKNGIENLEMILQDYEEIYYSSE